MTSSGKIRIYELSKDLGLENKDVLDAAKRLSIAVKSHSSSISDEEALKIKGLLNQKKKFQDNYEIVYPVVLQSPKHMFLKLHLVQ